MNQSITPDPSEVRRIALQALRAHPMNANVMPADRLAKLRAHIEHTGRYPPLIVRPIETEPGCYQVLDGHHRWRVLAELDYTEALCAVWPVDDEAATVLLTTLNRLQGDDDPHKRSALVAQLHKRFGKTQTELARLLPETGERIERMVGLAESPPPPPRPPTPAAQLRRAVHFFLDAKQRRTLEQTLQRIGGKREQALIQLVEHYWRHNPGENPDDR